MTHGRAAPVAAREHPLRCGAASRGACEHGAVTSAPAPRGEFDWIQAIRERIPGREDVHVGIGDDAAVVAVPSGHELVITTDLLVEDVDFVLSGPTAADPRDVGWKALAVSVSDIAAMGARPAHAVVSVALRKDQLGAFADRLLEGLLACASHCGVAIVGGDTSGTPHGVVVNVALTGFVRRGRAVRRSGARPGDAICVTGALGGSILGRHLRVSPREAEALALVQRGKVHAMIDVSDGLASDLFHVLDASGVGAEIWDDAVPVHDDARRLAALDGRTAIDHALQDGEDYELVFCVSERDARRLAGDGLCGTPVACIGRITADRAYVRRDSAQTGALHAVERRGHDHFRPA